MKTTVIGVALGCLLVTSSQVSAELKDEAATACTEAARLIEEDDFVGALDEAKWCVESLQQIKQDAVLTVFPDTIEGFKGGELSNQSAMGITILERDYSNADGDVSVVLTTGVAGGGLAALAQLGMGLGAGTGKKLRIQKRTVLDMSEGNKRQFMVQLKSSGMLNITSSSLDAEALESFVRAFPIAKLDDTLTP